MDNGYDAWRGQPRAESRKSKGQGAQDLEPASPESMMCFCALPAEVLPEYPRALPE